MGCLKFDWVLVCLISVCLLFWFNGGCVWFGWCFVVFGYLMLVGFVVDIVWFASAEFLVDLLDCVALLGFRCLVGGLVVVVFWIAGYCVGCLVVACFAFAR